MCGTLWGEVLTQPLLTSCSGKCSVTLLNETDILSQYLEKEVRKCWEKEEGGVSPRGKRKGGLRRLRLPGCCVSGTLRALALP